MGNEPLRQCVIPLHKPKQKRINVLFHFRHTRKRSHGFVFFKRLPLCSRSSINGVVAPFVEELAKVFPLFYRHGETERSIVTLGVLIGLGFGISEFFLYVVFLHVPPIARVPGVIFHASSASITAYGIAKKNPLPYYLISVMLHAANNFFAIATHQFRRIYRIAGRNRCLLFLAWQLLPSSFNRKNRCVTLTLSVLARSRSLLTPSISLMKSATLLEQAPPAVVALKHFFSDQR